MTSPVDLDEGFDAALEILRSGGLVAVPTETVYGLAADATNDSAVAKIFTAKGRPAFNPLISHVSGLDMAERYGVFNETAQKLAEVFWPGPLTLVVPSKGAIADGVVAGLDTVALRHPHGVMARLAAALDRPLAAPSANSSGRISPTRAQHVADDLGDNIDLVLDGGACDVGLESTIVKVTGKSVILLREGGVPVEEIETVVGSVELNNKKEVEAPGMLLAHYAPSVSVRLNVTEVSENEGLLAFGEPLPGAKLVRNLSKNSDLGEAARNLFAMMKELDSLGVSSIAVQSIPSHGLGAAINDRLKRAAHGAKHG